MLRAIIKRKWKDAYSGLETEEFETVDFKCDDLEQVIRIGGYGDGGFDHRSVVGVEVLPDINQ